MRGELCLKKILFKNTNELNDKKNIRNVRCQVGGTFVFSSADGANDVCDLLTDYARNYTPEPGYRTAHHQQTYLSSQAFIKAYLI